PSPIPPLSLPDALPISAELARGPAPLPRRAGPLPPVPTERALGRPAQQEAAGEDAQGLHAAGRQDPRAVHHLLPGLRRRRRRLRSEEHTSELQSLTNLL